MILTQLRKDAMFRVRIAPSLRPLRSVAFTGMKFAEDIISSLVGERFIA